MRRRALLVGLVVFACAQAQAEPPLVATSAPSTTTITPTTTVARTTTAVPTTTISEKGWLVIQGVGDVNLDPSYIPALAERGYEWAWSGMEDWFLLDDLSVVNLECAPSPLGTPEDKDFTFQCPDGFKEMQAAGIDVANLGNNHSQDFGKEAMLDGHERLLESDIVPVGAGANAAEAEAFGRFELDGWKVAVLGFGGVRPHDGWVATEEQAGMADGDTIELMTAAVRRADDWADWVVVAIHWGVELDRMPRPEDRERAQAMIAAGADVIFGHHPHRLQPHEEMDGRPVFWSLGNFVWPNFSGPGADTGVGRLVVSPAGEITSCLIPAKIKSPGHPVITAEATCGAPS